MPSVTIRDEAVGQSDFRQWALEVLSETMTVRELIRGRVYQEVQDHNQRPNQPYRGLVQPTESERTLNGYEFKRPKQVDFQKQFEHALRAFENNQILVLIGDRQTESLDELVEIKPGLEVTFLKLTLLVGG